MLLLGSDRGRSGTLGVQRHHPRPDLGSHCGLSQTVTTAGRPWSASKKLRMLRREMLADDSLNLVKSRSILFYHVDEHEDGNLIIFESCKCTRIIFRILAKNPHRVLLLMMSDTIIGDWVPLVNHKIDPAMSTDLPGQEQIKQPNSCVNMESMIDLGNTYRKSVQLGSMQGISWACVDLL